MGVVTRATAGRWTAALGGTLALSLLPGVVDRLPAAESQRSPAEIVAAARQSSDVAHQGLVDATGSLGLPDLPRLGNTAALLGGTSRARVWWSSPTAWRVDRITSTGESGTYAIPGGVQTWDFETDAVREVVEETPVRLPRIDDLLPPQAARRSLAGVTRGDRLTALPTQRVAGRGADGVRVVPVDRSSTIDHLDLYVDQDTGLPLSLAVVARGGTVALRTEFVEITMRQPAPDTLAPRIPPFTRVRSTTTPDLASAVDRYAPFDLPERLAGSPRSRDLVSLGGSATFGRGLAQFVLLPLPTRLGRSAFDAALSGGGRPLDVGAGGEAVLVSTPLLNAVIARTEATGSGRSHTHPRAYLVAGTVEAATLTRAVADLIADPPRFR